MSGRFGTLALDAKFDVHGYADKLRQACEDRGKFDPLLRKCETMGARTARAIARSLTGSDPRFSGTAGAVKAMQNWQREKELNDDLSRAQAKVPL